MELRSMLAERIVDGLMDARFVVRELRHRGSHGQLYLAYDQVSGERVALKILRPAATNPERFSREAASLMGLRHAGIVRHVAHGLTGRGEPYLVMEWLEGEDLAERLRRERPTVGEAVTIGTALSRALAAAHARGVVHGDLKPGSVLLQGFRAEGASLLDFGPGRVRSAARDLGVPGSTPGVRGYVAPEQILGDHLRVGPQADLFSLGCVLYETLAHPPFEASDPGEVLRRILFVDPLPLAAFAPGLPAGLAALVEQLLAKDPDDRPAGAVAVTNALEAIPVTTRRDAVRLSVVRGEDVGMVRVVGEARADIGRHPSASLVLRDGAVSRFHCELAREARGTLVVRDLGSATGLEVDGTWMPQGEVRDGAVLGVGKSLVRVERVDNVDCGPTGLELARSGDMNVMLEGEGDPRGLAERLHVSGRRRKGSYAAVYGSALRIADLAHLSGGTLLLLEAETLTPEAQRALADFAETRMVPTSRGRAHADVRLVASSAKDLRAAVNGRRFLGELFEGLAGVRVVL